MNHEQCKKAIKLMLDIYKLGETHTKERVNTDLDRKEMLEKHSIEFSKLCTDTTFELEAMFACKEWWMLPPGGTTLDVKDTDTISSGWWMCSKEDGHGWRMAGENLINKGFTAKSFNGILIFAKPIEGN